MFKCIVELDLGPQAASSYTVDGIGNVCTFFTVNVLFLFILRMLVKR